MSETGDCWIILGGSSAMARALIRELARPGLTLLICGRDAEDLSRIAADAAAAGAEARALPYDTRDAGTEDAILAALPEAGPLHAAVFTGSMPPQEQVDADPSLIEGVVADSFTGPARFLTRLAPLIEARGGCVIGIGSVAGDRGRIGNYVYGAAKAGFHTYLAGLRNRLTRAGAHVVTVKPGFVDTAMTWGLPGLFLVAPPQKVARDILNAVRKRRDVIYTPGFWWLIMTIIRLVPERIFKKLSI